MKRMSVASTPLYKPYVYCELSKRADLMMFMLVQREIEFIENEVHFSPHLASFFGLRIEQTNFYIGVPNELWPLFSKIDWTSFSLSDSGLSLNYNQSVIQKNTQSTFTKQKTVDVQVNYNLSVVIPIKLASQEKLRKCWVLHLSPIKGSGDFMANDVISITSLKRGRDDE